MANFCSKCGNAVNEADNVCSKCGNSLNNSGDSSVQVVQVVAKPKIPGRGFGIAAMVLSIIGILVEISGLTNITYAANANASKGVFEEFLSMFAVYGVCCLLALIFGVLSVKQSLKNGQGVAGLILGLLGTVLTVVNIVMCCVNM